jgi:hypothetical protein
VALSKKRTEIILKWEDRVADERAFRGAGCAREEACLDKSTERELAEKWTPYLSRPPENRNPNFCEGPGLSLLSCATLMPARWCCLKISKDLIYGKYNLWRFNIKACYPRFCIKAYENLVLPKLVSTLGPVVARVRQKQSPTSPLR